MKLKSTIHGLPYKNRSEMSAIIKASMEFHKIPMEKLGGFVNEMMHRQWHDSAIFCGFNVGKLDYCHQCFANCEE